jgi:fermentation-respiration switch protein FrsA (DUF1100 family)
MKRMKIFIGNRRIESFLSFSVKALVILAVTTILIGFVEVNNALHPPRLIPPGNTLREENISYQYVDLITDDGIRLAAWYTPPRKGAVILLAHGYGDNRPEWIHALLAKKGYGVLSWDARAHGESDGEISTIGYLEALDVKAALEYALAQPGVEHVGAWGGSMGGATLIRAAADFPEIEALFVDSSFATLDEEVNYLVPVPILNPLTKFLAYTETGINVNSVNPLHDISLISPRPVYIVHGTGDTVAPPNAGRRLFEAAGEPRFLWEAEGVGHMLIYLDNPRRYKNRLVGFFDEWLLGK